MRDTGRSFRYMHVLFEKKFVCQFNVVEREFLLFHFSYDSISHYTRKYLFLAFLI